ncbi:MAG TPA: DUF423 domain-containing protein [Kiritimatiellia bacterium]|nr:DUF423 domain-containing protein [Kiritimatiellia bacterium]
MERILFVVGCLSAATAVGLGGARAHVLERFIPRERLAMLEVGMRYQFIHSMGLLWTSHALIANQNALVLAAGVAFLLGILLFTGAMYGFAFTGRRGLLKCSPAGGAIFFTGWLLLAGSAV